MIETPKIIILDRDGVINHDSPDFIKSPAEWLPIPGSLEAIAKLNKHGFTVIIASNQSGIGRQLFSLQTLEAIHQKMHNALKLINAKIDQIFFCPHLPEENCFCRKPKPGLFIKIAKQYGIDYSKKIVYAIGDSLRDLEAAAGAGACPILVETGNGKKTLANLPEMFSHIKCYSNLAMAVDAILRSENVNITL